MSAALPMARLAVNLVAGLGVSKVIADIVANNTLATTTAQAVLVKAGGLVLGSMAVEASLNHVNSVIEGLVTMSRETKDDKPETPTK